MKSIITFLLITPIFLFGQDIKEYKVKNKNQWCYEVYEGYKSNKHFKHGKYTKYSGNKKWIKETGFYKDNLKDSTWVFLSYNGNITETGKYKEGAKVGEWTFYHGHEIAIQKYNYTTKKITYHNENNLKYKLNDRLDNIQNITRIPLFIGGQNNLITYLNKNSRYPAEARENNIQGTVLLSFDINIDGSISNIKVVKSLGGGLDEDAIRVAKSFGKKWVPGELNGEAVKSNIIFPFQYKLAH